MGSPTYWYRDVLDPVMSEGVAFVAAVLPIECDRSLKNGAEDE